MAVPAPPRAGRRARPGLGGGRGSGLLDDGRASTTSPTTRTSRCRSRGFPPDIPDDNPTGVYERDIEVPGGWRGGRIVLHVGAAESVLIASIDGDEIGVSKDSHLAAEFDVTDRSRRRAPTA